MRRTLIIVYLLASAGMIIYLARGVTAFPMPPENVVMSKEPADTETPLRIAFFTDMNRSEIMDYYLGQYKGIRTNLPPEDAVSVIRDQTRSTFLEEIVIPMKSSLYINGFEPKNPKDAVIIDGRRWRQKITVRYVDSNTVVRVVLALILLTTFLIVLLDASGVTRVIGETSKNSKKT